MVNGVMNLTGTTRWNFKGSERDKKKKPQSGFDEVLEKEKRRTKDGKQKS